MRQALVLCLALIAASCQPPPPSNPHYVLGVPYEKGGVWYYPRDSYESMETGLATVYPPSHAPLTTDGEVFAQSDLAAAHQTLQLPAVARITNLENGRQVLVRINDRGPDTPHRLIEVTRRTAALLQFGRDDGVRVRLEILPAQSHAAVDAVPGAPMLDLVAAPIGEVQQSDLPPPGSTAPIGATRSIAMPAQPAPPIVPSVEKMPDTVTQGHANPGQLFVQLGTFQSYRYAGIQRAQLGGLGATIVSSGEGRQQVHRVIVGPLPTVEQADIVLDQVLRAGVTDARIVVE